jgi:hypothetical protein
MPVAGKNTIVQLPDVAAGGATNIPLAGSQVTQNNPFGPSNTVDMLNNAGDSIEQMLGDAVDSLTKGMATTNTNAASDCQVTVGPPDIVLFRIDCPLNSIAIDVPFQLSIPCREVMVIAQSTQMFNKDVWLTFQETGLDFGTGPFPNGLADSILQGIPLRARNGTGNAQMIRIKLKNPIQTGFFSCGAGTGAGNYVIVMFSNGIEDVNFLGTDA